MGFFSRKKENQIGFIQSLPTVISEDALLSDGYIKLPSNELSKLDLLVGQSVRYSVMRTVAEHSWILYLPNGAGGLQISKQIPGTFNPMTIDGHGRYTGMATVKPLLSNNAAVMMSIFAAMAIVTGQHYLTEINDRLTNIEEGIESILNFLEADKRSRIAANAETIGHIQTSLLSICANEIQRKETVSTLQGIARESLVDAYFYRDKILTIQKRFNKSDRKDKIQKNLSSIRTDFLLYEYSISSYALSLYLEAVISRQTDTDYIQGISGGLAEKRKEFEAIAEASRATLVSYIENASAYSGEKILVDVVDAPVFDWVPWMKEIRKNVRIGNSNQEKARDIISIIAKNTEKLEVLSAVEDGFQSYNRVMNGPVEIVHFNDSYYLRVEEML